MKPTKPIKSIQFRDRFKYNNIFDISCCFYELYSKEELIEFIKIKRNNSYSIVKIDDKYLLILKMCDNEVLISTINGNQNCIDDIINL